MWCLLVPIIKIKNKKKPLYPWEPVWSGCHLTPANAQRGKPVQQCNDWRLGILRKGWERATTDFLGRIDGVVWTYYLVLHSFSLPLNINCFLDISLFPASFCSMFFFYHRLGKIFKKVRAKNLAFCLNKKSFSGLLLIFLLFPQCIKLEKSCWPCFPTEEKK